MKRWKAAAADDRCEVQSAALVHAAADSGFKVLEMPVERTQEAQIEALRALVIYQVDAIVFTPLEESGWDNVLREAKSASVPLIAVDRSVRGVEGVPLYHIGFDYAGLAERAAAVLSPSECAIQRGDQPCKGVYPRKLCGQCDLTASGRGGSRLQPESFLHRVFAGDRSDLCRISDRCPHRGGKASADQGQQPHERYCV